MLFYLVSTKINLSKRTRRKTHMEPENAAITVATKNAKDRPNNPQCARQNPYTSWNQHLATSVPTPWSWCWPTWRHHDVSEKNRYPMFKWLYHAGTVMFWCGTFRGIHKSWNQQTQTHSSEWLTATWDQMSWWKFGVSQANKSHWQKPPTNHWLIDFLKPRSQRRQSRRWPSTSTCWVGVMATRDTN